VEEDTASMISTLNPQRIWLEECCETGKDFYESKPKSYRSYEEWCNDGRNRPMARNNFYQQLCALEPKITKTQRGTKRVFRGFRLNALGLKHYERYRRKVGDDEDEED
jgi:hypothetical protein